VQSFYVIISSNCHEAEYLKGRMSKVTIVRIPSLFATRALTLTAVPPIGIAYVASSLRLAGHEVKVVDSIGDALEQYYYFGVKNLYVNGLTTDQILQRIPTDSEFIGVSFPFSNEWPLAKRVCLAIKKRFPQAILFAGGEHATAMPEHCLLDCPDLHYIILGEGEETVVDLVNTLSVDGDVSKVAGIAFHQKDGELFYTNKRNRMLAIDEIPHPAWDLIPLENYLAGGYSYGVNIGRTIPLIATRGCPYQCTFCSNPQMWTTRWLARVPLKVVEEMEEYIRQYRVENFDFYDLTAVVRKDWIIEFCKLLIERKLNITWQLPSGTRSEALDEEVTGLLYNSGCRNLTYAPESGSPEILKKIKKKINPDRMIASMKSAITNKINIKANIIVGFPGERLRNILETYKFIVRMALIGVDDVSVWTFTAYPGSEIFHDLQKQGRLPPFDDKYFYSLLSYSDLRHVVSWSENFGSWQLKYLRLFGLLLFYAVRFTVRPLALFHTLGNIIRHKPESRMEMIVEKAINRHKNGDIVSNEEVLVSKF